MSRKSSEKHASNSLRFFRGDFLNNEQQNQFRKLIKFLNIENPYYKSVFKTIGFDIENDDIDLIYKAIPMITKEELIYQQKKILTPTLLKRNHTVDLTSGSSGNVLKCYKTIEERSRLALNIWTRRKKLDPLVSIHNYISIFDKSFETVIGKFYNTSDDSIINMFTKILSFNPRWISGPISIFERFARLIDDGYPYTNTSLYMIEFMGEYVDESSRSFIEKKLNCKTVNNYGAQEVWCIGYECNEHNLHLQEKFCFLSEFGDKSSPNELIITSFNNYLMPIIKYRIGDVGKIICGGDCLCGNKQSIIHLFNGRCGDIIYGSNILGNYFFDQVLYDIEVTYPESILTFQVEQDKPNHFIFHIVKGKSFVPNVFNLIVKRIKKELGSTIMISFDVVDKIEFGRNGKLKKFIPYKKEIYGV